MKISKVHLTNFKRFTDLLVDNIPGTAKLVVIIGSNGSGKSSLFDAFAFVDHMVKGNVGLDKEFWNYFSKKADLPFSVNVVYDDNKEFTISSHNLTPIPLTNNSFYGRTSFRQIPRLTRTSLGQGGKINFQNDSDRPRFFIERDNRFENDVEKITEVILKDFFRSKESNEQIRNKGSSKNYVY